MTSDAEPRAAICARRLLAPWYSMCSLTGWLVVPVERASGELGVSPLGTAKKSGLHHYRKTTRERI